MPLAALIVQRLGLSLVLLWAVSVVVFLGIEALPGDFAETYLGQSATPQAVANIRQELGLDQPALTRYFEWLGGALTGDFGNSWASGASVTEQIGLRLGNTLRSEEHTSELQSLMRISYAVFCLKKKTNNP